MMNHKKAFTTTIDIEAIHAIKTGILKVDGNCIQCQNTIQLDAAIRKAADYLRLLGGFDEVDKDEANMIIPDILEDYRRDIRIRNYEDKAMCELLTVSEYIGVKIAIYMYEDIDVIPYN